MPVESPDAALAGIAVVLEPYHGKYATHPEFQEIVTRLEPGLLGGLLGLRKRLGHDGGFEAPVRIRLVDHSSGPLPAGMWTQTEVVDGRRVQVVTIATETLFIGSYPLDKTLVHEAAHCWQQVLDARRSRLPRWLREGLALWLATDGEEAVQRFCSGEAAEEVTLAALVATEQQRLRQKSPGTAYAYMAVLRMVELAGGVDRGDSLPLELSVIPNWEGVLHRRTGLSFAEFEKGMEDWALGYLSQRLKHREVYLEAKRDYRRRSDWKAGMALWTFADEHPESPLAGRALAEAGRAHYRVGQYETSRWLLEQSREKSPHSEMLGDIAYLLFLNACRLRESERARDLGANYLRDFPYFSEGSAEVVTRELQRLGR